MKKISIILMILTLLIVVMFINSKEVFLITRDNINFLLYSFIPSLLPFIIILSLLCELGFLEIIGYFLQFIFSPLLNIKGSTSALLLAGTISGYPLPSLLVSNKEKISEEEQQVISIFVFPSLAFLLNQIAPNLNNTYSFNRLMFSFYLGAFLLLFILRLRKKEKVEYVKFSTLKTNLVNKYQKIKISQIIRKCIVNSVINMVIISSNIIIFSLISLYLGKINYLGDYLKIGLEFSKESIKIVPVSYINYLKLISVLLFGGVSIFMQNSAILAHTNFSLNKYIYYRVLLIITVIILDILIFL